jgi:hypothetical protein
MKKFLENLRGKVEFSLLGTCFAWGGGDYVTNTIGNSPKGKNPTDEVSENSYPDSKSLRGMIPTAHRFP